MIKRILSYLIVLTIVFFPGTIFPETVGINKVGEWGTGLYQDVFVQGNYAYCAAKEAGLDIIDISNPTAPWKVANVQNLQQTEGVIVIGNCAYVIFYGQQQHLRMVDVTNPSQPILKESTSIFGYAKRIDVKGKYAYAADGSSLRIIDAANPFSPKLLVRYEINREAKDVFVKGNYAYVATGKSSNQDRECAMVIIDISNHANPCQVGKYHAGYFEYEHSVYVSGSYAYWGLGACMVVLDVSKPKTPVKVANLPGFSGNIMSIHVSGSYAYLADEYDGLKTIDISDPTAPTLVGSYKTTGDNCALYYSAGYVYLAAGDSGLHIVDVSNPFSPTGIGCYDTSGQASNLDVNGNYVYLAHHKGGLQVIDISEPGSPTLIGGYDNSDYIYDVFISGHYAYVVDLLNGLEIFDVSNPSSPELKGNFILTDITYEVKVVGNYAYVLSSMEGLNIIDVSNPKSPKVVETFSRGGIETGVYIQGDFAYLAIPDQGLQVIDISNPASPVLKGAYQATGYTRQVFVSGNYAYLADGDNGLLIIDVSDPTTPTLVGSYNTSCVDVYVVNNYAYAACGYKGLLVIDVSDPTLPTLVAGYDTPLNALAVKVKNNYIYVADGLNGKFFILEIYNPTTTPGIRLDRTKLTFASTSTDSSINTGTQSIFISNSGGGTLNWSVSVDKHWLSCLPSSGVNNGEVLVSVDTTGLPAGTYFGTITINDANAVNSPQTAAVTLKVYKSGETSEPFGVFATPSHDSIVCSSVPFTGWVLDDMGVQGVQIFREEKKSLVYIGDAVFVEGARPDVEQAYPWYPNNYKAGWGYMMLTNFLPNNGNGTFNIQAIATDIEGNQVTLGTKTIICDNANAVKPFGVLDTPTQGGIASGSSFVNWGWVLTPLPNRIPTDGSTIKVWVDGVSLGNPVYSLYREDIALLFPGYLNSSGAGGYFYIDTTQYANGVHTLQWTATDDAGNTDGIGSRYFTIQNTGSNAGIMERGPGGLPPCLNPNEDTQSDYPIRIIKGYSSEDDSQLIYPNENRVITVKVNELERVEIHLSEGTRGLAPLSDCIISSTNQWHGFQVIGTRLGALPVGSTLERKKGIFYWQPGPGFVGEYRFLFIKKDQHENVTRKNILVEIIPF